MFTRLSRKLSNSFSRRRLCARAVFWACSDFFKASLDPWKVVWILILEWIRTIFWWIFCFFVYQLHLDHSPLLFGVRRWDLNWKQMRLEIFVFRKKKSTEKIDQCTTVPVRHGRAEAREHTGGIPERPRTKITYGHENIFRTIFHSYARVWEAQCASAEVIWGISVPLHEMRRFHRIPSFF